MLQQFQVTPGGRQINARGSFFIYESGPAGGLDERVSVRANGQDLGKFMPGDYVNLPEPAETWEVVPVSATATCVVRLGSATAGSFRLTGSVRVIDEISANVQTEGGSNVLTAAGTWVAGEVVAPGENVRGIIVRSTIVSVQAGAGGTMFARLSAAPSAPGPNGAVVTLCSASSFGGYAESSSHDLKKRIPVGWGLYHLWNIGGAAAITNTYSLGYELL